MKLVGAILNCPTMWNTAKSMLDAGFRLYTAKRFVSADTVFLIPVQNGAKKTLCAAPIRGILYPTETGGEETFAVETSLDPDLKAPVRAGDTVGSVSLLRNGVVAATVPIVAAETVEPAGFGYYLRKAVSAFFG